jgi:hypothetical protein
MQAGDQESGESPKVNNLLFQSSKELKADLTRLFPPRQEGGEWCHRPVENRAHAQDDQTPMS